jgi:hypothetical protein
LRKMNQEVFISDYGGRRSGIELRRFHYAAHSPERRQSNDRRGLPDQRRSMDRRSLIERRTDKGQDIVTGWSGPKDRRAQGERRIGNKKTIF